MPEPKGILPPAQYEIMQVVWSRGAAGATVAEIWQTIAQSRSITRTTILNQVDRLEKRHWLKKLPGAGVSRYVAAVARQVASARLAREFVGDFFGGSASSLMTTLLGSSQLKPSEIKRLRQLLEEATTRREVKGDDDDCRD